MKINFFLIFFTLLLSPTWAKTVKYELIASKGEVNLSGKKNVDFALMINGTIPAPTLEFTEGDEAEITLINNLPDDEVSIHWHGILLDPFMDGVPYVNTPPIFPGEKFTFKFKVRQHGTYWYHSHTNVQEQKGIYGGIVIHPKKFQKNYDKDLVVVLSDWSDDNPSDVLKNLRKDGDYYLYKKGTMRSYLGAMKEGSLKNFLYNEWTRMGGMDLSDVGYDAFLINGKKESSFTAKKGERIRLRIINATASSYFYVSLGKEMMNIISLDGVDIMPSKAKEFIIGMAETYDILFTIPENKSYELKATVQDGTGETSLWIGDGEKVHAPIKPMPDMYATMDHSSMDHGSMDHGSMNHSAPETFTVDNAMANEKTEFPGNIPLHNVKLVLDGDMSRYIWYINGKAIYQDRNVIINEGEIVRFTLVNNSMMHHPMHLHGHFFRVINQHGEYSPMKHTVDVPPHQERVIEFKANEPGEWMLHCHNLYHLKTGMARVVKYSSFTPRKEIQEIQKDDPHLMDHLYYRGKIDLATNHGEARFSLIRTWDELLTKIETRYDGPIEGDLLYKRWTNRFFNFVGGATLVERESSLQLGFGYILPFLVSTQTTIDQKARLRLDVEKKFQWSKNIYSEVEFTFRQKQLSEFEISLMYQNNWSWAAGLMLTEESLGLGVEYNF